MQALIGPLQELAEFEAIQKEKQKEAGVLQISGCVNSQKTHMMYALGDGCKYRVIACSSESKARQVYEEYHMLDSENLHSQISAVLRLLSVFLSELLQIQLVPATALSEPCTQQRCLWRVM